MMKRKSTRIAAAVALAVLLIGMFGLGTGSVAFSQVGHALSSTLSLLREMIMQARTERPAAQAPLPPDPPAANSGDATNAHGAAIACAARFFAISANEQGVWKSLEEQGIDLIKASADPEVYYAALTREQGAGFDDALTVKPVSSPRLIVPDGTLGAIVMTGAADTENLALGWQPELSRDGTQIESTISFHDGRNGFEIPSVGTETGGVILIRARGIIATGEESLILLHVDTP
jgi:hypothetical protein